MENIMKKLEEAIPNEYEAVLVASKLARRINQGRVVAKDQMAPEEFNKMDQRKVTSIALEELASGKVKLERRKPIEEESTFELT
jgi:DNA-directed RNA polymerase omega subunit